MNNFIESLSSHFHLMKIINTHNICVTDIEIGGRKKTFYEFLSKKGFVQYSNEKVNYDFVVVDTLISPVSIYDIYQKHNNKILIFDTPKLFSRKHYIDVAEGGFCSSPDSGSKWKVNYDGKKEFLFTGHVIILTSLNYEGIINGGEKFKYLIRDLHFIK